MFLKISRHILEHLDKISVKTGIPLFFFVLILAQIADAKTGRYRCMFKNDPSSEVVIGWDQRKGADALVYFDTLAYGADTSKYRFKQAPQRRLRYKRMNNRFARLENLQPSTVYYFVIADEDGVTRQFSFKTLSDNKKDPFSMIAGGDSRNHREARQRANVMVAKLRPDLVMFGGDMTGLDNSAGWKSWFDDWQLTISEDGRMTPIIAARGNHERNNYVIDYLFDSPNKDIYFATEIHGGLARLYTLNSLISAGGKQKRWLEADLMENQESTQWKLAQYHHPMRPHTAKKGEAFYLQKYWAPLFEKYGMDVAVECDAHVVKTTYPIRPSKEQGSDEGFIRDDDNGTIYVGEGCWGAPLRRNNDDKKWTRASGSFNQFKWFFISQEKMEIRTIKTDSSPNTTSLTDSNRFTIPKGIDIWEPDAGSVLELAGIASEPVIKNIAPVQTELAAVSFALKGGDRKPWRVLLFFVPLIFIAAIPLFKL